MRKYLTLTLLAVILTGCNPVYEYIFMPPERTELTVVPDVEAVQALGDSSYYISATGDAVVYDARTWKIEIKFMSDYQLNTFEFPEESDDFEFSANPFTYGNWVDPQKGFTPKRFSVFQVTIFNYSGAKLNYDPELTWVYTDRGDKYPAYAREKKNAKNLSLEEYYQKLKGTSGTDDEIFETRMGIARRTMLYFGKPVYKGDSRDGLIVFDPLVDEVGRLKVDLRGFITAYDENNEPAEFKDMVFYFKQVPFRKPDKSDAQSTTASADTVKKKNVNVGQIVYSTQAGAALYDPPWNPVPRAIPQLNGYIQRNLPLNIKFNTLPFSDDDLDKQHIIFLLANGQKPEISSSAAGACASYLQQGGFLFIDNGHFRNEYPFSQYYETFLMDVKNQIGGKAELKNIPADHEIYTVPNKLPGLPQGLDEVTPGFQKVTFLRGLFINNRLAAIVSPKGYSSLWSDQGSGYDFSGYYEFAINLFTYVVKE